MSLKSSETCRTPQKIVNLSQFLRAVSISLFPPVIPNYITVQTNRTWCFPELRLAFTHPCKLSWTPIMLKSSHSNPCSPSGLTADTRLPSRGQTRLSSLSHSNVAPLFPSPPSGPRLAVLILHVCCRPLQCCAEPHQQSRTPTWLADGGRITTSMPWSATSALKASSSATSLPSVAGPTVAGRDPGSSVQSVSLVLKVVQVQRLGFYWLNHY